MELMEKEHIQAEEKAIRYIAKAADGSLRDALSLLDQCVAFYLGQTLTYDNVLDVLGTVDTEIFSGMLRQVAAGDVAAVIHLLEELVLQGKEMGQFVTDFTWYMRNLLLVKSSPDSGELLDLSRENMNLLLEEKDMFETETLMRYIRIFSDLSSQLRYASQKRVLVEIALIRLCRPSMETNLDSVLERIRVLEERMEEGVTVVRREETVKSGQEDPAPKAQEPARPAKAAPEDLQRVRQEWRIIVGQTEGMFRTFLMGAVPKYNGDTGEAKLYVEFSNNLAEHYLGNRQAKEQLEEIIERQIGKYVEVEFVLAKTSNSGGLAEISIDDILKDKIQMDIDIET